MYYVMNSLILIACLFLHCALFLLCPLLFNGLMSVCLCVWCVSVCERERERCTLTLWHYQINPVLRCECKSVWHLRCGIGIQTVSSVPLQISSPDISCHVCLLVINKFLGCWASSSSSWDSCSSELHVCNSRDMCMLIYMSTYLHSYMYMYMHCYMCRNNSTGISEQVLTIVKEYFSSPIAH